MCTLYICLVEDIWEDFKHNGRDYEYCPDPKDIKIPTHYYCKKKNKKPQPTECVFCKNNGEDIKIYKTHLLKDINGRILCPILRYRFLYIYYLNIILILLFYRFKTRILRF
jgi:hypothetical protein